MLNERATGDIQEVLVSYQGCKNNDAQQQVLMVGAKKVCRSQPSNTHKAKGPS